MGVFFGCRRRSVACAALAAIFICSASAAPATVRASVHPRVHEATDLGAVDPAMALSDVRLELKPTAAQTTELEQLLEAQRDPTSDQYQRWLTPEEFGARFGAAEGDLEAVRSWLRSQGFTVTATGPARNWISFTGTAAQASAAFRTSIHRYSLGQETHFANATEISVPEGFGDLVAGVRGLHDFRPRPQRTAKLKPDYTASNSNHYLAPDDIAVIYDIAPLYAAGIDGTGMKLAIAGQTDINLADIRAFRAKFGLTANDPQIVLDGADPGTSPDDQIEADLDLEWSGAVARKAQIVYVNSRDVFQSVQYAVDNHIAPVISLSYGACETDGSASFRSVAQQANAQGITWMTSSGDSGAAGCDWNVSVATQGPSVSFPANIPEVTAVGGSEFMEAAGGSSWNNRNSATLGSATGWIPEKAWNDTSSGDGLSATGGGASRMFTKPWWQAGPGVPADNARDVPDVALSASGDHDGYLLYAQGSLQAVGGTSASTPVFAGLVALLNQSLLSKGVIANAGVGNINPNLYNLAQNSTGIFHDITTGDNIVPCQSGSVGCGSTGKFGYAAGPGYDLVTGLGSVDAANLVNGWAIAGNKTGTSVTVSASPASIISSASTQLTVTVAALSGTVVPTGSVAFSTGSATLGSAALVAGKATITVKGSSLQAGANAIAAAYTPSGSFAAATGTVMVTISAPPMDTKLTLSANATSFSQTASTTLTISVKAASGTSTPAGSVTVTAGKTQLGNVTLVSGAGTLTIKGSQLAVGANTVTATYNPATGFNSSTGSITLTVAAAVATTTSVASSAASVSSTQSVTLTATVKAPTGNPVPQGVVAFGTSGGTLGTATLNAAGIASLTVKATALAAGTNTITAAYAGSVTMLPSSGSVAVSVTGSVSASPQITALAGTSGAAGLPVTLQVNNPTTGISTITGFSVNGTDYSGFIVDVFGTTRIAAKGTVTGSVVVQWNPMPATLTFTVSGLDSTGHKWSQTATVATSH